MAINVGSVVAQFKSDLSDFKRGLSEVKTEVKDFADQIENVGRTATKIGGVMTLALTVPIVGLGTAAAKAAADYEQSGVAFETMLGSAEKAATMLKNITDMAMKTPFQVKDIETGAKQLLAYGISSEVVLKDLGMLGDIASGVGMDKLPNLILAFGQVNAATRLTGMELRQFTEAGVPMLQTLADNLHKPVAEIQDMVSNGEIKFKDVEKALSSLTGEGGKFFNLMEKQSKTTAGQMSNLQDNVTKLLRAFGAELLPTINKVVDYLNRMTTAFQQLSPKTRETIVTVLAVVAALGPIIVFLGSVINGIGMIIKAVKAAAVVFKAIGVALAGLSTTVLIVIGIIVALAAAAFLIYKNWGAISSFFVKLWGDIVAGVTALKDSIVAKWEEITSAIVEVWNNLVTSVTNVFNSIISAIAGFFVMIGQKVADGFNWVVNALVAVGTFLWEVLKAIASPFLWLYNNVVYPIVYLISAVIMRVFYEIYEFFVYIFGIIIDFLVNQVFIPIYDFFVYWFTLIWNWLVATWNAIYTWFTTVILIPLLNFISFWLTTIYNFFVEKWTLIKNWINETLTFIKDSIIIPLFTAIGAFVTAIWEWLVEKTKQAWEWIKEHILAPLNQAKTGATNIVQGIFNWISDKFNSIVTFLQELGPKIIEAIVKPFREAKQQVEEWAQKIKDAADKINPFHRNSPSLVDNVRAGVKAIQEAYEGIGFNLNGPSIATAGIGVGNGGNMINISMDGANITDPSIAEEYAEMIGDKILAKLSKTVRT